MTHDNAKAAYWSGYESAITGRDKPNCTKYQREVDLGWNDGKYDLSRQLVNIEPVVYGEK